MTRRAYFVGAYYASWAVFGGVGLLLNLVCLPLMLLPRRAGYGRRVRAVIRRLFRFWLGWFHACGVAQISWHGFEARLPTGCIYIANHPTLLDATFLLSRLPEAICIFKPSLMRNPAIGPAAIMAGYLAGEPGVDLVRDVAARISAGQSLLVFPEGTRTGPGEICGALRPGFALIASRAHAPVQLVEIRSTPDFVTRGRPWWKPPGLLPARVGFTLGRRWEHDAARSPTQLTVEVEAHLRERLGRE
jgi:1-acyl-sn-glycerol-3-phosphate acyltransferase